MLQIVNRNRKVTFRRH